jgi:hypothetical protein
LGFIAVFAGKCPKLLAIDAKLKGKNMTNWIILNITLLVVAYLLGSISTGYLAGKLLLGIDIRVVT